MRPETEMGEANDQSEYINTALTHFTEETKKMPQLDRGTDKQTNNSKTGKHGQSIMQINLRQQKQTFSL